ncbi:MAG: hypothetical protein ACO4CG_13810, partial [Prochlorothrix sp.]
PKPSVPLNRAITCTIIDKNSHFHYGAESVWALRLIGLGGFAAQPNPDSDVGHEIKTWIFRGALYGNRPMGSVNGLSSGVNVPQ